MRRAGRALATTIALVSATTVLAPPPAQATTVNTVVFAGSMTTSGGMGLPCTPSTTPGGPKCNPGVTTKLYPLPGPLPDNTKVNPGGGNVNAHTFSSTVCIDATANVDKPGKAFTHAGTCAFTGSGSVSGWCGLNLGEGFGSFLDALGQVYTVEYNFNVFGTVMIVLGHTTKLSNGQTGLLLLTGTILPQPFGTSCTHFFATQYQITLIGATAAE